MSPELPCGDRLHRILLADDQPVGGGGLEALLSTQADLQVCGRADSGTEVLRLLRTVGADAVVLEVSVADNNGVELIREIGNRFPDVAVLVTSMHDETMYAERALRAAATSRSPWDPPRRRNAR